MGGRTKYNIKKNSPPIKFALYFMHPNINNINATISNKTDKIIEFFILIFPLAIGLFFLIGCFLSFSTSLLL